MNFTKDGIYSCGTLRSNRVGFPTDLTPHVKKRLKSRSDFMVRQCKSAKSDDWLRNRKQSNRLSVTMWQDNRPVVVASTNCDPTQATHVQHRLKDGSRTSIPCPSSIFLYNKYMDGVDNNDQLRGYYSVRTKGNKSYKYIWWFVFDVAVTNMYILAKHHSPASIKSVKQFRASLASAIISNYNSRKQRGRSVSSATPSHCFLFRPLSEKSREKRSMSLLLSHEEKTA